jgi:hypothetical protein
MQSTTLKELRWIHDCILHSITYDASSGSGRSIRIAMRCPPDLGYAPWEGKNLVLVAIDVALSKHFVRGVGGPEIVDAIRSDVSADVQESMVQAMKLGARFPNLVFTMTFHSGSMLEVVCQDLQIESVHG